MKELDDVLVEVEEIRPLPTSQKFAAKVHYFYVNTEKGRKKIERSFGEVWGETYEEAEAQAIQRVRDWLDANEV